MKASFLLVPSWSRFPTRNRPAPRPRTDFPRYSWGEGQLEQNRIARYGHNSVLGVVLVSLWFRKDVIALSGLWTAWMEEIDEAALQFTFEL